MNISIGEKLKNLRKSKDITQEMLADFLGVSFQTISKWERGECFPDIIMLPSLANFFEVTIDELMGMNEIRSKQYLDDIYMLAHEYEGNGKYQDATDVLRKAIKTFPNNYSLLSELALSLAFQGLDAYEKSANVKEAIELCERVLANCTSEKVRSTTRANLCFLYSSINEQQKAIDLARTLPHIWECREMILPDELLEGSEYLEAVKKCIFSALSVICEKISTIDGRKKTISEIIGTITLGSQENVYTSENLPQMLLTISNFIEYPILLKNYNKGNFV